MADAVTLPDGRLRQLIARMRSARSRWLNEWADELEALLASPLHAPPTETARWGCGAAASGVSPLPAACPIHGVSCDRVCQHGTALDVHCCHCHAGFIFEKDHECPPAPGTLELHRCKLCGTRWLLWPDDVHGGGWNLLDKYSRPGACCDNVAMGDQIEHLRDIPLLASPLHAGAEPEEVTRHSVVKDWLLELPLRMRSTVLLSLRGPDGCSKENGAKVICRELRFVVLNPAFPKSLYPNKSEDIFMGTQTGYCSWTIAEAFWSDHDVYPHHWLMHLLHAAEIVGQFHSDETVRMFWFAFYEAGCRAFHMNTETIEQLSQRLVDPPQTIAALSSSRTAPQEGEQ